MSFIFGGGGGGGGQTQSGSSVVTQREAPGVEARKLSLYDQAAKLASTPVSLPAVQVAPLSGLEQAGIAQAGQVGVGAGTVGQGITALQGAQAAPNISSFLNPYQSYVTDEITRQAGIATNRLGAQAVASGAFGGGRQGIAEAEIERARLANIGQAQAQGFQRGIGQAGLEAQRQTALQRQYEPYQRIEFLKGIMTNLPTTQSTLTATTAPGANPVGQALGAGLGAYSAYNLMQPR